MRQTAGALNRTWLALLGVLALAGGVALLLQAAGVLQNLITTPPAGNRIVAGDLHSFFAQPLVVIVLLLIGAIVGVLALAWIIAQVPRRNPADAYRLHADGAQGRTICDPSVLAGVVENQANTLPGVVSSSAVLRGSANEPDLTLQITVNDRADIQDLLRRLETTTLPDLSTALETPLYRCRLQFEVTRRARNTGTVVHSTGTVLQ